MTRQDDSVRDDQLIRPARSGHYGGIGSLGSIGTIYEITTLGSVTGKKIQVPGGLSVFLDGKSLFSIAWKGSD
jgi:hypothetical protein